MHNWAVYTTVKETHHPMWKRMWTRAGVPLESIRILTPGQPVPSDVNRVAVLGESMLEIVTGHTDLFRWRGRRFPKLSNGHMVWFYPTLQPSRMLPSKEAYKSHKLSMRPTRFQGAWIFDIQRMIREEQHPTLPSKRYLQDPPAYVFQKWALECLTDPTRWISFDIETHYKLTVEAEDDFEESELKIGAMLRISFAYEVHSAVSVPWQREYLDTVRMLLESPNPKVVWNGAAFDVPKLREEGFVVNGPVYDFQDGWHLLESDQPKGLEYVSSFYSLQEPWKHLSGAQPALYSCIDADVALENALGIKSDLEYFNQWDLFLRHVVELMPILEEAGRRGNMVDTRFSDELEQDLTELKARMIVEAQALVPDAVRPRKRYKKLPDTAEGENRRFEPVETVGKVSMCTHCRELGVKKTDHFKGGKKNPCKAAGADVIKVDGKVVEWDEILPFNPNSSDQMQVYARHFKHPLGKNRETDAPSMNAAHLEKLAGKYGDAHPLYGHVVTYHKVCKTLSTYIYRPDADGLIHTTYVNAPSTWRLASRNYNLQNVGKRESNKWAKKARRQIVARPGHIFVQADSTSIEAVITGHMIGDENFIAVAKKSIHAYLTCGDIGIEFTDAAIELVKAQHKDLYNKFKVAVYLLLYGGDPYLMHMTDQKQFPTIQDAQLIQDKIFGMMPKLKEWQEATREQAKKDGVLTSPWGYRHKFYDVYTFKKNKAGEIVYDDYGNPVIKPGKDSKRSLAFRVQNSAGAFCRDTLLVIGQSKWRQYMPANITVHDGYTLEVPDTDEMKMAARTFLVETLTRPIPELGMLRIGCEVDMGYNWADASEDNPDGMRTVEKVEV